MKSQLLSIRDVVALTGRSFQGLYLAIWSGKLRAVKQGKRWLIAREDIEPLMKRQ